MEENNNQQQYFLNPNMTPQQTFDPATVHFNVYETPAEQYISVGLSMDNLIENPKAPTPEPVYEHVTFDNLIHDSNPVDYKFALQMIPIDEDRSMLPKPIDPMESIMNNINSHINNQQGTEIINNRKLNNWFTRLIDQRGEEYITSGKLSIDEISRNAERIIDDIVSGRIDYNKQSQYIIMPIIIETLISYCSNKLAINRAIQFSLGYIYNDYTNMNNIDPNDASRLNYLYQINDSLSRNITQTMAIVNQDIMFYNIVFDKLSYVNATKNVSALFNLASELATYRKQVKKRF